jgi:hypothetical protein
METLRKFRDGRERKTTAVGAIIPPDHSGGESKNIKKRTIWMLPAYMTPKPPSSCVRILTLRRWERHWMP